MHLLARSHNKRNLGRTKCMLPEENIHTNFVSLPSVPNPSNKMLERVQKNPPFGKEKTLLLYYPTTIK